MSEPVTSQPSETVSSAMSLVAAEPSSSATMSISGGAVGGVVVLDQERKIRREIANSNERRRMQSINAGFQSLRTLLPQHEGEKLSKAAILQQTAEYIYSLEQEKTRLLAQNCQLKRLLSLSQSHLEDGATTVSTPIGSGSQTSVTTVSAPLVTTASGNKRRKNKHDQGVVSITEPSKNVTPGIGGSNRTVPHKLTMQSEDVALRLIPATANAEVKRSSMSEYGSDMETCHIIVAPTSEAVLKENLIQDSGSKEACLAEHATENSAEERATTNMSKVEIETIPNLMSTESSTVMDKGHTSSARSYIVTTSSSKQNLDSIVEAIRHLEGDHLFTNHDSATLTLSASGEVTGPQQVASEEVVEYSTEDKSGDQCPTIEAESTSVIILNNCS